MHLLPDLPTAPTGFRHDLVRWQQLVSAAWLGALLAYDATEAKGPAGSLAAAPAGDWLLLEVGFQGLPSFLQGHIPRAGYLDTTELEELPFWNKVSDADLLRCLLRHGIRHSTTVVLYSRSTIAAARAAHLMLYAGVRDVRLLDGGFDAWCQAGQRLSTEPPRLGTAVSDFGARFPTHPAYLMDTPGAKALLQQGDGTLVSIRTWNEFMGTTSGYSYIPALGDIVGARWGHAGNGSDVNSMSDFQHDDGTMRAAREIAMVWAGAGIHADQRVAFYCGTGWRASLAFFYAWLMGWERISVYDGGWLEWSADPANPRVCRS